jgi:hypothetical protein
MSTHTKKTTRKQGGEPANLRISAETRRLLEIIRERDGIPYNAQVDRAMRMWAASKGIGQPEQEA